jgi:osmotically-inducible protein OsmY
MDELDSSAPYMVGHITSALATDERTHMLDIKIKVTNDRVFLLGTVTSEERRSAAEAVVREHVPGHMAIVNGLCVESYREPTEQEHLG